MKTSEDHSTKHVGLKFGLAAVASAALVFGSVTPAFAADVYLGPEDIAGYEDGAEGTDGYNYDEWHIGNVKVDTSATSDVSLEFNECSITTLDPLERSVTQVMKGYPIDGRPSSETDMQAVVDNLQIVVESGSVTLQLPVFEQLTDDTEYWAGTFRNQTAFGPGTHSISLDTPLINDTFVQDHGWSNGDTLEDFYAEMQQHIDDGFMNHFELLGVGFTGQPGSVISSITFDGNTYHFGTDCDQGGGSGDNGDNGDGGDSDSPVAPTKPARIETGL
ncbi:MAG: hypothetical protein ACTHW3_05330 [Leucobacter sp.]